MNRRNFLQLSMMGLGAVGLSACNMNGSVSLNRTPLGVQLYMLRESMAKSPEKTLKAIADIGFKEIEMFGFGKSLFNHDPFFGLEPSTFKALLDQNGLTAPIAHLAGKVDDANELSEIAKIVGVDYFVIAMPPEFVNRNVNPPEITQVKSLSQLDKMAERLSREAIELKKHNISFGYHNHNMEFQEINGVIAFDYLMDRLDPSLVNIELDLGWVAAAGFEPSQVIHKYGKRIKAVHLKDYSDSIPLGKDKRKFPIAEMARLVLPGQGVLDFDAIFKALDTYQIRHRFIEVDITESPLIDAQNGYKYLRDFS